MSTEISIIIFVFNNTQITRRRAAVYSFMIFSVLYALFLMFYFVITVFYLFILVFNFFFASCLFNFELYDFCYCRFWMRYMYIVLYRYLYNTFLDNIYNIIMY